MTSKTEEGSRRNNKSLSKLGSLNPSWKGGKRIQEGYVRLLCAGHPRADRDGYAMEHIVVFEQTFDCCVLRWGVVHHRDGNKLNNVWYNLQGMTIAQHLSLHWKGKKRGPFSKERSSVQSMVLKGKKKSEEWKRKISEAHKRRSLSRKVFDGIGLC